MRIGILWTCCDATCFAQERPAAEPAAMQRHGLPEILSQKLYRDRQIELLLRSAESGRERGDAELMRESLLAIFSHPHDVFELDADSESATSLQNRALSLLMQSSPELQRSWVDANRVIAAQELESAIRRGGRHDAARVARAFPLTEAGIQAQVIDMSCELLKGDPRRVAMQVRQLEELYSGTVLQAEVQRQLRPLKERLTNLDIHDTASHSALLSFSASASDGTIAPPWPQPLWTWRERIWNFPGTPQPESGGLLSWFEPEARHRIHTFNNWRPVFWNDSIVIRTPFRIVALNRASGQEHWSVPTDTFKPQSETASDELEDAERRVMSESQSPFDATAPIYGMAEFGLLATDSDFLYFVDRFSFFAGSDPYLGNSVGRVIRNRNGFPVIEEEDELIRKPVASRLVALRRGPAAAVPVVAWQIGDGQPFQYDPVSDVELIDTSNAHESSAAPKTSDRSL
ncbi:MAG: hypothetical protein H7Z17_18165, partial [Fuerstia sp.]|nr:hypothetical protein [Fuerstiella sp.]